MKNPEILAKLRSEIFTEPSSESKKPAIITYIKILLDEASLLSSTSLTTDQGHSIAIAITGALAFQGAEGVEGKNWITKELEPELYEILDIAGRLDAYPDNEDAWKTLFYLVKNI